MVQIGSYSKMTYLIKHPITRKMPKFALVYKSVAYALSSGSPTTSNLQLDTIIQSDGMGLSLSSNQVILGQKRYYIECRASITIAEAYYAITEIKVNGSSVSMSVQAKTASYTAFTPVTIATAVIDAMAGDVLTFSHGRSNNISLTPNVDPKYNKFLIMEIV